MCFWLFTTVKQITSNLVPDCNDHFIIMDYVVGGLDKHIDDVLSASQCLSIKWNNSSFHFQYSFLLICWDKRKAVVYIRPVSHSASAYMDPTLVVISGVWLSPKASPQEKWRLRGLFSTSFLYQLQTNHGSAPLEVKGVSTLLLMTEWQAHTERTMHVGGHLYNRKISVILSFWLYNTKF